VARPGAWDLTAVVGQLNRQQVFQDNANGQLEDRVPQDMRHTLMALRAERFGLGPANLGAHAVAYGFVQEPGWAGGATAYSSAPDAIVAGGTAEFMGVGGLDGYFEGDAFHYTPEGDLAASSHSGEDTFFGGQALYGSLAAYPGDLVVLLEGKRYLGTSPLADITGAEEFYVVAAAPTLEYDRAITIDSNAAVASNDITGARLRVDWSAVPGTLVPYMSAGYFVDRDLAHGLHTVPEHIVHPLMGLEWLKGERSVLLNVGHRVDDREGEAFGADRQTHGDVVLQLPLVGEYALNVNVAGEHFQWGENDTLGETQTEYVEFETSMTVAYGATYAGTIFCDYTTQAPMNTEGNLFSGAFEGGERPLYGAVELQWKPQPATTIKAFYGAYKSGIRCAGGQCRQLPGFEGGRLAFQSAF